MRSHLNELGDEEVPPVRRFVADLKQVEGKLWPLVSIAALVGSDEAVELARALRRIARVRNVAETSLGIHLEAKAFAASDRGKENGE